MRRKKEIAINTHLWLPIVYFVIFLLLCISCIDEGAIGMAIGFAAVALLALFIFLSYLFHFLSLTLTLPLSPICTVFPALPWEETPVVELPVLDVPRCRDPGLTLPSWV